MRTDQANATDDAPRRGRPRDVKAGKAIVDAALEEMALSGYQGMSMDGIAARAGVSKPTIYRRWPNKPSLAIGALEELVSQEHARPAGDVVEDLTSQLHSAHRNLERSGSVTLLGTVLAEQDRHPEFIETWRERLHHPRRAKLEHILAEARARGEIRADVDLKTASLALVGLLFGKYLAGERVTRAALRRGVGLILEGCVSRPR